MNAYTYTEARQRLARVLEQAAREGQVRIKRRDGQAFVIRPERHVESPLDVEGLDLDITADEVGHSVREGRRTLYGADMDWRELVITDPECCDGQA